MPDAPRRTAADFHPDVMRLFDQYVHGLIDRRGFLDRAARHAAGFGGAAGLLAALSPDFAAAQQVAPNDPRLKAEFVEFASPNDERVNAAWPPYEAALKQAGVRHQAFRVPGTQHGFNNDTTPRYDQAAARQAWARTIDFFNRVLRS
jgi:dienelactone hydrolase